MKPSPTNLKIAFVDSTLELGGTTTYLTGLLQALSALHDITPRVYSLAINNPLAEVFARQQVPVLSQDERRLIYEDRLANLLAAVADFGPHSVVAWHGSPAYEVLRYVPDGVGRLAVLHGRHPQAYADARPFGPIADVWVGVSQLIAQEFAGCAAIPPEKIHAIGAGVEIPADPVARTFRPSQPLRVLYLGRLEQDCKRAQRLADVYEDLARRQVPVQFTLAGDGPEKAALMQRMRNQGPTQPVRFLGNVSRDAIPDLLRESDILLLVSDSEGLPVSLLEGMAYGLVPVVSNLPGGIGESVDDHLGRLVDPDNLAGYAGAIQWLHEHRAEMAAMATACQTRAREKFSATARAQEWLQLFQDNPRTQVAWPASFKLKPRLVHGRRWDFYPPAQSIRRLLKRWQTPSTS